MYDGEIPGRQAVRVKNAVLTRHETGGAKLRVTITNPGKTITKAIAVRLSSDDLDGPKEFKVNPPVSVPPGAEKQVELTLEPELVTQLVSGDTFTIAIVDQAYGAEATTLFDYDLAQHRTDIKITNALVSPVEEGGHSLTIMFDNESKVDFDVVRIEIRHAPDEKKNVYQVEPRKTILYDGEGFQYQHDLPKSLEKRFKISENRFFFVSAVFRTNTLDGQERTNWFRVGLPQDDHLVFFKRERRKAGIQYDDYQLILPLRNPGSYPDQPRQIHILRGDASDPEFVDKFEIDSSQRPIIGREQVSQISTVIPVDQWSRIKDDPHAFFVVAGVNPWTDNAMRKKAGEYKLLITPIVMVVTNWWAQVWPQKPGKGQHRVAVKFDLSGRSRAITDETTKYKLVVEVRDQDGNSVVKKTETRTLSDIGKIGYMVVRVSPGISAAAGANWDRYTVHVSIPDLDIHSTEAQSRDAYSPDRTAISKLFWFLPVIWTVLIVFILVNTSVLTGSLLSKLWKSFLVYPNRLVRNTLLWEFCKPILSAVIPLLGFVQYWHPIIDTNPVVYWLFITVTVVLVYLGMSVQGDRALRRRASTIVDSAQILPVAVAMADTKRNWMLWGFATAICVGAIVLRLAPDLEDKGLGESILALLNLW